MKATDIFRIENKNEKTITKRDGTPYTFTEALLSSRTKSNKGDVRVDYYYAKVPPYLDNDIIVGAELNLDIIITGFRRPDDRVFNNYEIKHINGRLDTTTSDTTDDIPF